MVFNAHKKFNTLVCNLHKFFFSTGTGNSGNENKIINVTPNETQKLLYFDGIFLFHFCHGAK